MAMRSATVYITATEAERIRSTAKRRQKKCKEVAGQPRPATDALAVHQAVTMASLMADMAGPQEPAAKSETVPSFAVGETYPPCVVALSELQPIALTELRLQSHHRGRVLAVRRVAEVVELAARSWTVVEANGQKERLEMGLHKLRCGEEILESGKVFRLKEPYFTLNEEGEPTLRVDHPSDLVVCGDDAVLNQESGIDGQAIAEPSKPRKKCKEEGNAALKEQDLSKALVRYTEGLQLNRDDSEDDRTITYDLHRNRAHVNLLLSRFDEARTDALAAVTKIDDVKHRDLDGKAFFRAGIAAFHLGAFAESRTYLEQQQRLDPNDRDVATIMKRIEKRCRERETGEYDFRALRAAISRARPSVDAGSFLAGTQVRDSPGAGRGLFATRDFQADEIVMGEKAICAVWGDRDEAWTAMTYDVRDDKIRATPAGLEQALVSKLINNPSLVEKVLELYGDYPGTGKQLVFIDNRPVIDTFRIRNIIARNAFGMATTDGLEEDARSASTGLWVWAAYINHSCVPNVYKEFVGDLMVVRATRSIAAGEELFHSYIENVDYSARMDALLTTWGFRCRCALCKAEEVDGLELQTKRVELFAQASAVVQREHPLMVRGMVLAQVERLFNGIRDTYDEERYKEIPILRLNELQQWINAAKKKR